MPVKLGPRLSPDSPEPRIEIIPLIDIMFFLLASFMLVSLSMVNQKSVKVNLPTATTAGVHDRKDFLDVSVDRQGLIFLDKAPVGRNELARRLSAARRADENVRVLISADRDARHGDVVGALDAARSAGIDRVAFETDNIAETVSR